ncbi:MAG: site-specific integrase [Bacilli bacterium]
MEYVQPIRDRKQIETMKRVLRANPITGLRDHCLFVLGVNSGLRVSDLLTLRVADVADERGRPRDRIGVREQKTGKTKDFPLGDTAKKAIKEYLAARFIRTSQAIQPNEPLFRSKKGGALQRAQAWQILNPAARAIGITERIGTHTLRKTLGYWPYQSGVDVTRIQKLLNHSTPSITLAYIGITQEELDNVYLTLEL